jgi:NAD(P)-dependent dehydrogenase (short-subunit alcohol dehydrogenase family)
LSTPEKSATPVIVVTGAAGDIGLALSRHFARQGAALVMNDCGLTIDGKPQDPERVLREAQTLRDQGARVAASAASIAEPTTATELATMAVREFGALDVWINGAAILRSRMLFNVDDADWREVLATNLDGAFFGLRAALAHMRQRRSGRVINLLSASGLVGNVGVAGYGAAKAGLSGLTRNAALEMRRFDVAVNGVVPFARTRVTDSIPGGAPERDRYLEGARRAQIEHLFPLFDYLVYDSPSTVTGQIFAARGHQVHLLSQPRPLLSVTRSEGWDRASLSKAIERSFLPALVPLETEFDVFAGDPTT